MSDLASNKRIILYYWRHAARYPFLLWGMILSLPLAMLFNRFLPALITAGILNRLAAGDFVKGDVWRSFGPDILLVVGLAALGGIVIYRINTYFNWKLEGLVIRNINQQVFDHLMRLSANFHANTFGGSLVSQTTKLAGAYIRVADTSVYQVSSLVAALVFTSVILWGKATLFVILLNFFSLLYMACAVIITREVRYFNRKEADVSNEQTGHLADSITNVMAVKSFAAERTEGKHYAKVSEKARLATLRLMFATMKTQTVFSSIGAIINTLAIISAVASIVVYGADIATVFLVFTYTAEIRILLWEFSSSALRNYNRAFGDAQAMIEVLALEPDVKDPPEPKIARIKKGAITFRHMSFTHADSRSDDSLFVDLNLEIQPSEKIGLVGHSGSGKTTLTKLLLRFSDIDEGEILIDGQNITQITQTDLRKHIAYVPQEPLLFHRSIRENIAYGKPGASDTAIFEATQKAHAAEFIEKLPKGYETLVGERGVKLSGGQRQRVAIARAILKDAPILVLDEATSALDSESERLIQAAFQELMKGRTTVVIAHRLSTVQKMDRIVVLDTGAIIEQGSHQNLLKHKGTYASLWAHQSGGFLEE